MAPAYVQRALSLMMTLAGSQRRLAALVGVSHQKVGRWLTIGGTTPQGEPSRVKPPTDPATLAALQAAFDVHKTVTREQARIDGVPWSARVPVLYYRPIMDDGRPGDRIAIQHSHWMTDATRREAMRAAYTSRRFFGVSVRSTINIQAYNAGVNRIMRAVGRSDSQLTEKRRFELEQSIAKMKAGMTPAEIAEFRSQFNTKIESQAAQLRAFDMAGDTKPVYTPSFPMTQRRSFDVVMQNINDRLRQRHEPATGTAGTKLADEILLQLDPSKNAASIAAREARAAESRRAKAIEAKARRAKR